MSLSFYYIDKEYVSYLQEVEQKDRGFSHVPNVEYEATRNPKFVLGTVLSINGFTYYAPISSYKKQQPDNILINIDSDKYNKVKGSIRFNYMFPVPNYCITEIIISKIEDYVKRDLLNKEWKFCTDNEKKIENKARQTYSKVINKFSPNIVKNSCDFKLLEIACLKYQLQREAAATIQAK